MIKFNKKIYESAAVKSAIKAYRNLADFDVKEDKKYIKVYFKKIKDKKVKDLLGDEFCNYVLHLMR